MSDSLVSRIAWEFTEDFTNSDLQGIVMTLTGRNTRGDELPNFTGPKWKDSCFDEETYKLMLLSFHTTGSIAEEVVSSVYKMLNTAAMPKRTACRGRYPCYWWNNETRNLRSARFGAKRRPRVRE